jgi:uncharacterized protein (TIGR02118 family)
MLVCAGEVSKIEFHDETPLTTDEEWMTKISILYPNTKGSHFDFRYRVDKHMPLAIQLLSAHPGYQGVSVERGIAGAEPGSEAAYAASCHFLFDSAEEFTAAFTAHGAQLQADIPNYTNVEPVIQISEVLISS